MGANAPHRGESVETLLRRTGLEGGDELGRALGERQTFSGLMVELAALGRGLGAGWSRFRLRRQFGRHREFLGYRGFGVLGEEIEAEVQPRESAAEPIEPDLELAPRDVPEAAPAPEASLEADGAKPAPPALSDASEFGRAPSPEDVEAEPQTRETAAEPTGRNLEFPPADAPAPAPPPEISLEADGSRFTSAPSEAFEPERPFPGHDLHDLEAEAQARETAAEPIEPNLELPPTDAPEGAELEASLDADGAKSEAAPARGGRGRHAGGGGRATGPRRALRGERRSAGAA